MPRNAQGKYFLPEGNPVVTGELIKAEWANTTLEDVGNALTNSLDRIGTGGMVGPLKLGEGSESEPSLWFDENFPSGFYLNKVGEFSGASGRQTQFSVSVAGLELSDTPILDMEAATKGYVDGVAMQAVKAVGTFGTTKSPSDLPPSGFIPANWDYAGSPAYQMKVGQSLVYIPTDDTDSGYGDVYAFVSTRYAANGWNNIGKIDGPEGNTGEQGPIGDTGAQGPTGPQGDTGATGAQGVTGKVGEQGPVGPKGNQGSQGSVGNMAVIVGYFGASKTPSQLPSNGLIPANWDSVGNPPEATQLKAGEALVYDQCSASAVGCGDVYSYVGTKYTASGWLDCGQIVGSVGVAGETGPKGATGAQGPSGPAGTDGGQGPAGPAGANGPQGAQGPNGIPGPAGLAGPLIVGMIAMFTAQDYIPAGWTPCDGTNGTPDLRDKFVLAGGGSFPVGSSGGSTSITAGNLPPHTHAYSGATGEESNYHVHDMGAQQATLSGGNTGGAGSHSHGVNDPSHGHTTSKSYVGGSGTGGTNMDLKGGGGSSVIPNAGNGVNANTTGVSIQGVGDHTHTIDGAAYLEGSTGGESQQHVHAINGTTSTYGNGAAFMQPYYALIFAMYTGV